MRTMKHRKTLQKSIALASIASFLMMPLSAFASNNITAGNSAVGNVTNITNGTGTVTDITGGFIHNGTGFTHFGNFDVNGTANLNFASGANRYVNMVDNKININGVFSALNGQGLGNVMFISPEGMAVGANGVMNVGSLQTLIPAGADYASLIGKFGALGAEDMANVTNALNALKAGGTGVISIDGRILASGDVDLQSGMGIAFGKNGFIQTTAVGTTLGDVSLFTNTGDIMGSGELNIDAAGNITLTAKEGGIGSSKKLNLNQQEYGEAVTVAPVVVKVGEGKKLNVEVANEIGGESIKGYASVANNSTNLNVGTVKGANVKLVNLGSGTLRTTEAITDVDSIYLNAAKGNLDVTKNITAKNIVRLAANNDVNATGNLEVTDKGYISVYAANGSIDMADAKIKQGNIDVKANGTPNVIFTENGSVSHGNLTITERGDAEGYLRLTDDKSLSTGIKAPDEFRFDGIHVTSTNGNIIQKEGTKISSAGRVDLTAGGNIQSTVEAVDYITTSAEKGDVTLETKGIAKLWRTNAKNVKIKGENILVDETISGETVDITATDKVTIRPNTEYATGHWTYGKVQAKGDINVNTENGIFAEGQNGNAPVINSTAGNVKLTTKGDIKNVGADSSLNVGAAGKVDASAKNADILLTDSKGNVGNVTADNVYLYGLGDMNIQDAVTATADAVIRANNITQETAGKTAISAAKVDIYTEGNIGSADKAVEFVANDNLQAYGNNVYLHSKGDVAVNTLRGGENTVLVADGNITQYYYPADEIMPEGGTLGLTTDGNASLISNGGNIDLNVSMNGQGALTAKAEDGSVSINSIGYVYETGDLLIDQIVAGTDITINSQGYIHQTANGTRPAIVAGKDVNLVSDNNDVGASDNYLTVNVGGKLNAQAPNGGVFIASEQNLALDKVVAGKDVAINGDQNISGAAADSYIQSGENMLLISNNNDIGQVDNYLRVRVGGELDALAQNGNVYIGTPGDLLINNVVAGKDVAINADGNIHQTTNRILPAVIAGENMKLVSNAKDVGASDNYLTVNVGGVLDAQALNGGVFIASDENVAVDKVIAGKDVAINGDKNVFGAAADSYIQSGENMLLISNNNDIGQVDNYLTVKVGGELDALAQNGNVYIGTPNDVLINTVVGGKDVAIKADGNIHQTTNRILPAVTSGENMTLISNNKNVGDPNNYLTVSVGNKLDAEAPNGGVYIYGYGDLITDKIVAGEDAYIGGNKNILIPHDREEGNIIAGGKVTIEAGDSVLNQGGTNVGIVAGGDIEVTANLNGGDGRIGELPYNDLKHSINVTLGGEVIKDEIGVPTQDKILNIHIMGQETASDDFVMDDRDQKNMKISSGENDGASGKGNRQHLRYNVANGEYALLDSNNQAGAKVVDILNISKQGMLVETSETANVGDTIKMTLDYKGLPFTVEGEVVRVDTAKNTAGIKFTNLDQLTESMILYLGMMNGIK